MDFFVDWIVKAVASNVAVLTTLLNVRLIMPACMLMLKESSCGLVMSRITAPTFSGVVNTMLLFTVSNTELLLIVMYVLYKFLAKSGLSSMEDTSAVLREMVTTVETLMLLGTTAPGVR